MSTDIILHSTPKSELKDLISEAVKDQLSTFFSKDGAQDDRMLSKREVCEMLDITIPTLDKWTKDGIIPAVKFGRTVRFRYKNVQSSKEQIRYIKHSRYQR